jgi:hypothetical protein
VVVAAAASAEAPVASQEAAASAAPSKAEAAPAAAPERAPKKAVAKAPTAVAAASAEAPQVALQQLAQRVARLESQPAPAPPSELAYLRQDVADMMRKMDGITERLVAAEQRTSPSRRRRNAPRSLFATDVYLRRRLRETH